MVVVVAAVVVVVVIFVDIRSVSSIVQHLFTAACAVCMLPVDQFQLFGILRLLGLGTTGCSGCSMNLSGTKRVWFVKRPTEHLQSEVLQTALKLKTEQYHTLTEEQIRAQQTTHQPEIRWTDLPLPATKQAIDRDG